MTQRATDSALSTQHSALTTRIAYFDCFNGASGDMILGALLDAGASFERLSSEIQTLPLGAFEIHSEKINKQGLAARTFRVEADRKQPHRHLNEILEIIRSSRLSDRVTEQACRTFERLAEAEAAVHGQSIQKVHFHEVGAVDAIVDVVGACWALEDLGVEEVMSSPIPAGSGAVHCEHGLMPVPAPATAELLKNVPLAESSEPGELITPTGAAILTTLAARFGALPALTVNQLGYGAGQRQGKTRPNVLRVLIGEGPPELGELVAGSRAELIDEMLTVLQTNIDDQSPEILGYLLEALLKRGALDAFCQPIYMKKGRPGLLLTVLGEPWQADELEALIYAETTTFGVRRYNVQRRKLNRRTETVQLPEGPVQLKIASKGGRVLSVSPEFEDCRRLAIETGQPLKEIMSRAVAAWQNQEPGARKQEAKPGGRSQETGQDSAE